MSKYDILSKQQGTQVGMVRHRIAYAGYWPRNSEERKGDTCFQEERAAVLMFMIFKD